MQSNLIPKDDENIKIIKIVEYPLIEFGVGEIKRKSVL